MAECTLAYDFVNKPSLEAVVGPTLSITRATTGYVMGSDGYLQQALAGEARFTGAQRRENVCLQSEDFSTTWTQVNASATFNQTVAPDGNDTADKLIDSGATGTGNVQFRQTISVADKTTYTFSIFAKADQLSWMYCTFIVAGSNPSGYFDLSTGAVGTTGNVSSSGIEAYGNGWYRCWFTFTTTTESGSIGCRIYTADADADITCDLDGTSSIFVWGAQLERASSPSPYIPTTTAAVSKVSYASSIASSVSRDGLLVEEARTNLYFRSQEADSVAWTKTLLNVTANDAVAPDGSSTADKLEASATATSGRFMLQDSTLANATEYIVSYYVKAAEVTWVQICGSTGFTSTDYQNFDISNGVLGNGTGFTDAGIEALPNSWYRIWVSATTIAAGAGRCLLVALAADTASRLPSEALNAGDGFHVWGAQIEAGTFRTSYIPTTTTSVTRNADVVSGSFSPAGTAGTMYVRGQQNTVLGAVGRAFVMGSGAPGVGNSVQIASGSAGNQAYTEVRDSDVLQNSGAYGSFTPTTEFRAIVGHDTNDLQAYANGSAGTPDTSVTIPTRDSVYVGSNINGVSFFGGHIKEISFYPERLSNSELDGLSDGSRVPFVGAGESVMTWEDFMARRRRLRRRGRIGGGRN